MTSTTLWNFNKFLCISLSFFHWIFFSFFSRLQGNLETTQLYVQRAEVMIELPPYRRCWLIHYHSTSMWIQADLLICMWGTDRNACAAFTVTVPFIIMRSFCEVSCTFLFLCLCVCLSVDCQKKAKRKYRYRTFNLLLYSSLYQLSRSKSKKTDCLICSILNW